MTPMLLPLDWPDPIDRPRPEPLPAKVSSDLATDGWGDDEPRDDAEVMRERRWLARRILIVRAVALVELKAARDCREAWKMVRQMYERGDIWLPANV